MVENSLKSMKANKAWTRTSKKCYKPLANANKIKSRYIRVILLETKDSEKTIIKEAKIRLIVHFMVSGFHCTYLHFVLLSCILILYMAYIFMANINLHLCTSISK